LAKATKGIYRIPDCGYDAARFVVGVNTHDPPDPLQIAGKPDKIFIVPANGLWPRA